MLTSATISSNLPYRDSSHTSSNHPRPDSSAILTTWKDVARYMGKGVRTVQRWERDFGLPVRRPARSTQKRAILALAPDLDAWVALKCSRRQAPPPGHSSRSMQHSLREQMEASIALRTANRMLLNELNTAVEALQRNLAAMYQSCSAAPEDSH